MLPLPTLPSPHCSCLFSASTWASCPDPLFHMVPPVPLRAFTWFWPLLLHCSLFILYPADCSSGRSLKIKPWRLCCYERFWPIFLIMIRVHSQRQTESKWNLISPTIFALKWKSRSNLWATEFDCSLVVPSCLSFAFPSRDEILGIPGGWWPGLGGEFVLYSFLQRSFRILFKLSLRARRKLLRPLRLQGLCSALDFHSNWQSLFKKRA